MKNSRIPLLIAIFTTVCFVQAQPTKYIKSITKESLKTNLYIVASDEMEGRDTGSKGQKKAGEYLISQYLKAGIAFPTGATDYYQRIPTALLNSRRNENLPSSENIWAFIKGSEKPEEILVISAHYDHIGITNNEINHGADDDGSGTVAVLEIAKAFQKAKEEGHGPKRSILFLHVTGEEHGLLGSKYYSENPLFPIVNTITDVNIDMIGRRDEAHKDSNNYIYLIGSDYLSSDLYTICEEANKNYVNTNIDYTYNDRNDPNRFIIVQIIIILQKKEFHLCFYLTGFMPIITNQRIHPIKLNTMHWQKERNWHLQ